LTDDKMVELDVVENLSHETVRQTLRGRREIDQSSSSRI
jgi:hypothetical protein